MVIKAGDSVLVYYDLLLYDAVVLKVDDSSDVVKYFVHFSEWTDNWDTWIAQENVLEDTPSNRERQKKVKDDLVVPSNNIQEQKQEERPAVSTTTVPGMSTSMPTTVPGSERLTAMIGWMKTLDDALTRLDKQVKDLVHDQIKQEAGNVQLAKRKAEADVQRAELDVEVARDLKRVKVAEETAMARKRLRDAGISQEEIDTILPAATR
ncbi:Esa1p-associated factor [Phytophthora boehmeriae]|uniref:Esa1p-associated factor n=1 Tax=Phytophthora boehmeriae TaxID=109152 RepID=A0A8T1WM53_9STRA|nr:Esa1p-associated factor [Phytophthora boehmeriae]